MDAPAAVPRLPLWCGAHLGSKSDYFHIPAGTASPGDAVGILLSKRLKCLKCLNS